MTDERWPDDEACPDPLEVEDADELLERLSVQLDGTPKSIFNLAAVDDLTRARARRLANLVREAGVEESAEVRRDLDLAAVDVELSNTPVDELASQAREYHGRTRSVLKVVLSAARKPVVEEHPILARARSLPRDWLSVKPAPRRWLLEQPDPETDGMSRRGWLPLGKVGMLTAAGGVGKTMVLLQLAIAVATGRDWFGLRVASPGRVLLALAEEDADEVRRRIFRIAERLGLDDEEMATAVVHITLIPLAGVPVALLENDQAGNLAPTRALESLRQVLSRETWRLVVLDPLSRFAGPDTEKDAAAATRFVQAVETLTESNGNPTVLLAHHTNKLSRVNGAADDSSTAARGSTALVDGVRWEASLSRDAKKRTYTLRVGKSNYAAEGEPITLAKDDTGLLMPMSNADARAREKADTAREVAELEERIAELVSEGAYYTQKELATALRRRPEAVGLAVSRLLRTGKLSHVTDGRRRRFEVTT